MMPNGFVYLVGAGPGNPDLITVRGLRALQKADVVAYDRLVHPDLLLEAPPHAELIHVGKAPNQQRFTQGEINALLVARGLAGQIVVRLKGGDPFVFGRGGEEGLALAEAGVPFEIVPGVSSAIGAASYAGIPVTHRQVARSFTVVTGHTAGTDSSEIRWPALAQLDTLVFLMGMRKLPVICEQLQAHGMRPDMPVAIVRCGTTDWQTVITGTLTDICQKADGVFPPAIIVVGEVVNLREKLAWFTPDRANVQAFPAELTELVSA